MYLIAVIVTFTTQSFFTVFLTILFKKENPHAVPSLLCCMLTSFTFCTIYASSDFITSALFIDLLILTDACFHKQATVHIQLFAHSSLMCLICSAPEVVGRQRYGRPVDCWAIGVVMYILSVRISFLVCSPFIPTCLFNLFILSVCITSLCHCVCVSVILWPPLRIVQ